MKTKDSLKIMQDWFASMQKGDMRAVIGQLAANVVFNFPRYKHNKVVPYLGIWKGRKAAAKAFKVFDETFKVMQHDILGMTAHDNEVCVKIFYKARCIATNALIEIEDIHYFMLNDKGKIALMKVYFDSYLQVEAFKKNIDGRLITAVAGNDLEQVKRLLEDGANPCAKDAKTGLPVLGMAAGQANAGMVKVLLKAGADVFAADSRGGATALHKACQGGSVQVARLLVDAGAFVDAVAPTTGHTPLMDALWFKHPDLVQYLLNKGAGLELGTHYGFSLLEHFNYELKVNVIGKDKLLKADKMIKARQKRDQAMIRNQKLMKAVTDNDLKKVKKLLSSGAEVDERSPVLNGFNDFHTPLLIACRSGYKEIVAELLKAGADANAVEPTFGSVPLHKAAYNGYADVARILVRQPRINLNAQGPTNGYTALHDSLWHGHEDCARVMIEAGARLDIRGHDGKLPFNVAADTFGKNHVFVKWIKSRMAKT